MGDPFFIDVQYAEFPGCIGYAESELGVRRLVEAAQGARSAEVRARKLFRIEGPGLTVYSALEKTREVAAGKNVLLFLRPPLGLPQSFLSAIGTARHGRDASAWSVSKLRDHLIFNQRYFFNSMSSRRMHSIQTLRNPVQVSAAYGP
jgi:hypothetical protein